MKTRIAEQAVEEGLANLLRSIASLLTLSFGYKGRKMNEKLVVERLRDQLTSRFRRILSHQNLANLPKLKSVLVDYFGYLPVLNEVDMILVGHEGELCAIEVKYFTIRDGSFDRPFYDGIGQSLSLLRYGFDSVAL